MNLSYKIPFIICLSLVSIILVLPNYFKSNFLPDSSLKLGLDLKGGSHLLLKVDFDAYLNEQFSQLAARLKQNLRKARIGYQGMRPTASSLNFYLRDEKDAGAVKKIIKNLDRSINTQANENKISVSFSEKHISYLKGKVIDQSLEIVRMRVDQYGTKEPTIQRQGDDFILLQLPGANNPDELKNILGQTAKLTFHLVDDFVRDKDVSISGDQMILEDKGRGYAIMSTTPLLTGDMLVDAQPVYSNDGQAVVSFEFNHVGSRLFAEVTKNNVGRPLAIVLDGKLLTAPNINTEIKGGKGIITGNFTLDSASELSLLLRAGSLPAPIKIIEERVVGPSLGSDSVQKGKVAFMVAIGGVMGFMLWMYGIFGMFANIALMTCMLYMMSLIGFIGATLTMPGIAGIILTIGMAVDANILIYERIREDLKKGYTKKKAIFSGFDSAFSSILDSNVTTLIASLLLYAFGTGVIKGFAVTLSIGILTSMFSAIVITKMMFEVWLKYSNPSSKMVFEL